MPGKIRRPEQAITEEPGYRNRPAVGLARDETWTF